MNRIWWLHGSYFCFHILSFRFSVGLDANNLWMLGARLQRCRRMGGDKFLFSAGVGPLLLLISHQGKDSDL